jgi:cephalosporin hydroxylase
VELKTYTSLISVSIYYIVFDIIIEHIPKEIFPDHPWESRSNSKTGVSEYFKNHSEFNIDKQIQNKLLITVTSDGYLKRIKN